MNARSFWRIGAAVTVALGAAAIGSPLLASKAGPSASASARPAPPSSVGLLVRDDEAWRRRHADQPIDPAWGPASGATLAKELRALAPKARDVRADCRTDACVAVVAWDDCNAAQAAASDVRMHDYSLRCVRKVKSTDSPDAGRCETTLLLDCTAENVSPTPPPELTQ